MKTIIKTSTFVLLPTIAATICLAQQSVTVPASTPYVIVSRGLDFQTFQRTNFEILPSGQIIPHLQTYEERATGLNFMNPSTGQLEPSKEEIDLLPDGSAGATNGQSQAFFPIDVGAGTVRLVTPAPESYVLESVPISLTYSDGTHYATIAELTNSVGEIISSNQVLYPKAMAGPGVQCDILFEYRKSGLEQDVIFRTQPPAPERYGLSSAGTRLQLATEFFNSPTPSATAEPANPQTGLADSTLSFGQMKMIQGRAFLSGNSGGSQVPTYKSWVTIDSTTAALVEQVPYEQISASLATLPVVATADHPQGRSRSDWAMSGKMRNNGSAQSVSRPALRKVSLRPFLPPSRLTRTDRARITRDKIKPDRGFCFDYIAISGNETDFEFRGDEAYFVSSPYYLFGKTVIDGGAIIKMNNGGQLNIDANGTVDCETGPYNPAIFTSYNENDVGDWWGNGNPKLGDVNTFLSFNSTNVLLHDLHFAYASNAVVQTTSAGTINLWDCQFVDVATAVSAYSIGLYNVLIGGGSSTNAAIFLQGTNLVAENVTADYGSGFVQATNSAATLALTNCLVTRELLVTTNSLATLQTNAVVTLPVLTAPVYQVVGGGNYYLTNGSAYATSGTANINPDLLPDVQGKTVWPPYVYGNTNISFLGTLSPSVPRDTNCSAIGFHYSPLDVVFGGCVLTNNLKVTNGTVVGWFEENGPVNVGGQPYGVALGNWANMVFNGNATEPCYWVQYGMVQERGNNNWNSYSGSMAPLTFNGSSRSLEPILSASFAKFIWNDSKSILRDNSDYGAGLFKNCEFYDCGMSSYDLQYLTFTNCLFVRPDFDFWGSGSALNFTNENCTYYDGGLALSRQNGQQAFWSIENTIFDGTLIAYNDYYNGGAGYSFYEYNAYNTNNVSWATYGFPYGDWTQTNTWPNLDSSDLMVSNMNWETSWFGNFYLPTNSPLIQKGSTNANLLGLYHFTSLTNDNPPVVEGTNTVNIGYAYVGTDANGNPLSTPGDGTPDYIADANGNGIDDTNETPWDIGFQSEPQSTNVAQGQNVTFSATVGGIGPFTYQWLQNSNPIAGATNSWYAIYVVQPTNDGNTYSIIASNADGHVQSTNAILSVSTPIALTSSPSDDTVTNGGNASFTVTNSTGNHLIYQWYSYYNGVSTPLTNNTRIAGVTGTNLTISPVQVSDGGHYYVVVGNAFNSVPSRLATLTVITNPVISGMSPNTNAIQSDDVTFSVTDSGEQTNQWYFSNVVNAAYMIPGATQPSYTQLVVQPTNDGEYFVEASNLAGSTNAGALLNVLVPPWITSQPASTTNSQGQNATFSITAIGTTNLSYQWFMNGTNAIVWATNSSMTLTNVGGTNAGGYSCLVSNVAGTNMSAWAWLCVNLTGGGTTNGWGTNSSPASTGLTNWMVFPTNALASQPKVFIYGNPISIRAAATSQYGYVTNVAFYFTGTNTGPGSFMLAGNAVPGPAPVFALAWTNAIPGTNILEAVAQDYNGQTATSSLAYVIMAVAPGFTPAPGTNLVWTEGMGGTNIVLTAVVTNDGQPYNSNIHYNWITNQSNIAVVSPNSASTAVTFSTNGTYYLQLAVDNGYATNVQTTMVMIDRAPNVYFNWPTNGAAVLTGAPIVLSATAIPYDGAITSVIFTNSTFLGPGLQSVSNSYTYLWQNPPVWTNTVWAIASCSDGLSSTTPVTFAVHPPLTVQLESPTNGQLFISSPTNVLLEAICDSYIYTNITSVVFSNLTQSAGLGMGMLVTNSGYQSDWQDDWLYVTNGTNTVTVTAYDSTGNIATDSVTFIVNAMPVVSIKTPTNLQSFKEVTDVPIGVTATDIDDSISSVQLFAYTNSPSGTNYTTTLLGTATAVGTNGLYNFTWTNLSARPYAVTAVATDTRGSSSSSLAVFIVTPTNGSPFCGINYPSNNASFADGADITITATAYATNGSGPVTNVEFFVNGADIGGCTEPPYAITKCCWDPGTYQLTAIAADSLGSYGVSSNVEIIIVGPPLRSQGFWDPTFHLIDSFASSPMQPADACGNFLDPMDTPAFANYGHHFYAITLDAWNTFGADTTYSLWDWNETNWTRWAYTNTSCQTPLPFGINLHGETFDRLGGCAANSTGLYVDGYDTNNDGNFVVSHFDGTNWTQMGGLFTNVNAYIYSGYDYRLDDLWPRLQFIGDDLYIYGDFAYNPDTNIQYIARWDPNSNIWVQVGSPLNAPVFSIAGWDGNLVVGGIFTNAAGNSNANCIAELNGGKWSSLGTGVAGIDYEWSPVGTYPAAVFSVAACGSKLFVGGDFTEAGTVTNVNSIAIWNGAEWSSINKGLIDDNWNVSSRQGSGIFVDYNFSFSNAIVYSISPRGNTVYVAGNFTDAVNADGDDVSASSIIQATWNEASQQWIWSDLDGGIFGQYLQDGDPPNFNVPVITTTIIDGPSPGQYEVIAGANCNIWLVDEGLNLQAFTGVARWCVGYEIPASAPIVTITNPVYNATFTNQASGSTTVTISGTATSSYTTISAANVYVDGMADSSISFDPSSGTFLGSWHTGPGTNELGIHTITVTATDASNLVGSATISIAVIETNMLILAGAETYTIPANSPTVVFNVLTNCSPTNGLKISAVNRPLVGVGTDLTPLGSATVNYDHASLTYTPFQNVYGTDIFFYYVTNSTGQMAEGSVTVNVLPEPWVTITAPTNGAAISTSALPLPITGTNIPYGAGNSVTNVTLSIASAAGIQYTNLIPVNGSFTNDWMTSMPGFYTFTAIATDANGMTNVSAPVTISLESTGGPSDLLTALITNLSPTNNGLGLTDPVITQGLFDLQGLARDTNLTALVSYQVLLYPYNITDLSGPPLANITPGPLDPQGFHNGTDNDGDLGTLDFTSIQNGVYELVLLVHGGSTQAIASVQVQLNTPLKVGQFSFTEQDLNLPVNGIPITVTRTYNSQNLNSADFGYGWTFAMNSMNVQLDEQRQNVLIGSDQAPADTGDLDGQMVSIRTGGGWDVSLTLPNGQQTTFAFNLSANDYDFVTGLFIKPYPKAFWFAPPWVHATLTPINGTNEPYGDTLDAYGQPPLGWTWTGGNSPYQNQDLPGWILTTLPDQTQYYLTRQPVDQVFYAPKDGGSLGIANVYGPPTLTQIKERTGDSIMLSPNSIYHVGLNNSYTNGVVTLTRDGQGRVISISDPNAGPNGLPLVQYVYNQDTGNLIQVLKLLNRNTGLYATNRYDYNNPNLPHYITSVENADDVPVTRNTYDSSGRLSQTEDANDNITRYIYGPTGTNFEQVIDPLGRTNTFVYDDSGNITWQTNALGQVTLMAYDQFNNKTNEITFMDGQPYATNNYSYDQNGLMLSSTDPLGNTNGFTYNNFGEAQTTTDARGYTTSNSYDNYGELTLTIDALNDTNQNSYNDGLLVASTDPIGTITSNQYDLNGNLTNSVSLDASGAILSSNTYTYDGDNNRLTSTVWRRVGGNWTPATTTYSYDAQNRVIQTVDPDGGTNVTVYNLAGQQQATIDALGNMTSNTYDPAGHLVMTTYPDGTYETFTYDGAGNRTNSLDRLQRPTTYVYDALNRVVETIYPDGATNATVYDDGGRVSESIDARGTVTAFEYDAAGRRIAVTNGFGTSVANANYYSYDADGNQITFTDANGHSTTNFYDALNRQVQVQYPDGTTSETVYDGDGRSVAQTNQDGIATLFGYDGAGRLVSVTNALGQVTRYQYDEAGNEVAQIDALLRTNTYAYDGMGRRIGHTMPGGQIEEFAYDLDGNQVYATNFNGAVITNRYDVDNRLTNVSSVFGYNVSFAYSATGQRTNMLDPSGQTVYTYDLRDRLIQKTVNWNGQPGVALNYLYDVNGNVMNIASTNANGVDLVYAYDPLNRLTNVLDHGNPIAGYSFDLAGNVQTLRYGNGVTNQYQYDSLNRLTNLNWNLNATALAHFSYRLGATGNRTNLNEMVDGTNLTYTWGYDGLYRLTSENISAIGALAYLYDSVGNRLNRNSSGSQMPSLLPTASYSYGTNDWLASDHYDLNGSTTNSAGTNYQYDVMGHMTNAVVNGTSIVMTYDGDGNRVSKTVGGTTIYYLVDEANPSGYSQVLEEYRGSSLTNVYNYGLALISQRTPGVRTNYFVTDGHGSTRMLTDIGCTVVNVLVYDAYGNLIASNGTLQTAYLYSGQQLDFDLGLYYNRARYLNPGIGRFWTMDSDYGNNDDPLSLHKYVYAEDNPVNMDDPSGNDSDAISLEAGTSLAAGLAALTLTTVAAADAYSHGALVNVAVNETLALGGSAIAATESALSVYRTSVRDLIKEARDALKNATKKIKKLNVVPMPRLIIPNVAAHVATAQASGYPFILRRESSAVRIANYRAAVAPLGSAGPGKSWDEYPFASGRPLGAPASIVAVPAVQNTIQGGIVNGCYAVEKINVGDPYIVVVVP